MPLLPIPRLTLLAKLVLSFFISVSCMMAALYYSVNGLGAMHRMETEIARNDLTAATLTVSLREMMLAQQRYAGRYQILPQGEFKTLYDQNAEKFRGALTSLKQVYPGNNISLLEKQYARYSRLTGRLFAGGAVDARAMKRVVAQIDDSIGRIRQDQLHSLEEKLRSSDEKVAATVSWSLGFAIGGASLSLLIAGLMIYSFASSIRKLKTATHRIAAGEFDYDPRIPAGDEIGDLSRDFMAMARRLKDLEQVCLDASPLTRLPGNIAIERSINRRLREGAAFAMCYLDLDNFKSYNDRYGYIKASDLIRDAGRVIHDAVRRLGDPDAFVGHIGGDDFVVIIGSRLVKAACTSIIHDIDAMIPAYYSDEDRAAGFIQGVDRYGVPRNFPLISISIAAMDCQPGRFSSAAEIATAAAAVKDRVKEAKGSNYIIVREAGACEV
ncbi:diguanylate cyclase [Pelobacter propionicus]|uniref:diguanylate cyclase n=1 Tax=Pelobacter propionicus (strain DSM 2379 / NBRC 103807 / OttBd1) TaxID=338966 RepID=A1ARX1_PELPD|nr:diguanylate cyclase [Pelobacter propionicus]ABL00092.1 diguanylate cyclase [Pelobacter propionicus DSM 2379]